MSGRQGGEGGDPQVLGCLELSPSWQTTREHVVRVPHAPPAGEDLRVQRVPRSELSRRIPDGGVRSAVSISAVALLGWRAP